MLFRPTTVRDDRGRRISLTLGASEANRLLKEHADAHTKRLSELARQRKEREPAESKRPKNVWFQRLREWPVFVLFVPAGLVGVVAFGGSVMLIVCAPLIGVAFLLGWDWRIGFPATFAVAIAAVAVVGFRRRDTERYQRAKRLAAINVCGACGYSLESLEPGDDGLLECPECGAAWEKGSKRPNCPNCDEPVHFLSVNEDGGAECPSCGQQYTFAPEIEPDKT